MPEVVDCPQCQRKLQVPENLIGKKVKCPTCGTMFTADVGAPPPPPPREEERRPSRRDDLRRDDLRRPLRDDDEDDDRGRARRRPRRDLAPHRGGLILVLGIIGLVFPITGIILGPIAWVMGSNDLKEIRAGRMDSEGEGTTRGGMICGIIATILGVLALMCGGCIFLGMLSEGMR
jgi:hypothetical protein